MDGQAAALISISRLEMGEGHIEARPPGSEMEKKMTPKEQRTAYRKEMGGRMNLHNLGVCMSGGRGECFLRGGKEEKLLACCHCWLLFFARRVGREGGTDPARPKDKVIPSFRRLRASGSETVL